MRRRFPAVRPRRWHWFVLALLALAAFAACKATGASPADPSRRLPPTEVAVASAGALAGSPAASAVPDDPTVQDPEGFSLRGRAAAEGAPPAATEDEADLARNRNAPRKAPADDGDGDDEDDEDDEEEEEEKGYWKEVPFTREHFDEVRAFVDRHYIDDHIDSRRALIEAANFALLAVPSPRIELLPASFYELRRNHPDEEGRLDGAVFRLQANDPFILHEVQKPADDEVRRRLNEYEIRHLRLREKARHALLERHWRNVPFGDKEFAAVVKEALKVRRARAAAGVRDAAETRDADVYIAAAQGYLFSLDPHSGLISAKSWEESTRQTEDASFDGIGAVLTQRDNQTVVESPIEGQPAEKAGLRAGDVILKVDKKEIDGIPLFKVVRRIRGPRGTPVTLTVRRLGVPQDFDVTIVRAHIAVKNVSGRLLDGPYEDVGYIKLTGFVGSTTDHFDQMVDELTRATKGGRLRGLIFDLRNNNGGLLNQGVRIADRFLSEGVIVTVRHGASPTDTGGRREPEVHTADPPRKVTCPVVVLVDDGTASAAEIVASALQDNQRALVLGDRTFGKASVQTLYPPPERSGYYIKLTVARYYAPSGRTIQLTGVLPDLLVPPTIDGTMPLGFREENLRNPLSRVSSYHYRSPSASRIPFLSDCVKKTGRAQRIHDEDPDPQIKFDNQLYTAADYLMCMVVGPGAPGGTTNR